MRGQSHLFTNEYHFTFPYLLVSYLLNQLYFCLFIYMYLIFKIIFSYIAASILEKLKVIENINVAAPKYSRLVITALSENNLFNINHMLVVNYWNYFVLVNFNLIWKGAEHSMTLYLCISTILKSTNLFLNSGPGD